MTSKKDQKELDAMQCILHSAELGIRFEDYIDKIADFGRKRIRMISKELKE